jgi:HSP20 family protein
MNPPNPAPNPANTPVETDAETHLRPVVDITETPEAYVLHIEMPGVNKDRLTVTLEEDRLAVAGTKAAANPNATLLLKETATGSYRRIFRLSPEIDRERIAARVEQGLVTLILAKIRKPAPRRVEVV